MTQKLINMNLLDGLVPKIRAYDLADMELFKISAAEVRNFGGASRKSAYSCVLSISLSIPRRLYENLRRLFHTVSDSVSPA